MKEKIKKIGVWTKGHKIASGIILVVILVGGYFTYKKIHPTPTIVKYVLGTVEKGTIVASVSGTGQVLSLDQVDVQPKVSGEVTYVGVTSGQEVKAGAVILSVDATDALKALRDAQASLVSAQISLEKTKLQSSSDITSATQAKQNAEADLKKAYDDGYSAVLDTFLDLPQMVNGLRDLTDAKSGYLSNNSLLTYGSTAIAYRDEARTEYYAALKTYEAVSLDYKKITRDSSPEDLESIINETYDAAKEFGGVVKTTNILIDFIDKANQGETQPAALSGDKSTIGDYATSLSSHIVGLLSAKDAIKNAKESIQNAETSLEEKTVSLNASSGSLPLDIQSAEINVTEKENALIDARQNLADYSVRAPFDGVIAKADIKKGDTVSSASVAATIITKQKIATVPLNELDAAKVSVGDKATLTFDAIPDLSISGEVAEIDALGTVTQGVVNYTIKVAFDTQDERVKSGMSTSISIITDSKADVLVVPNSAIKSAGGSASVQVLPGITDPTLVGVAGGVESQTLPESVPIETGFSNDDETEVVGGLKEGDIIVVRTISSAAKTATTASGAGILGGRPAGGGATRIGR